MAGPPKDEFIEIGPPAGSLEGTRLESLDEILRAAQSHQGSPGSQQIPTLQPLPMSPLAPSFSSLPPLPPGGPAAPSFPSFQPIPGAEVLPPAPQLPADPFPSAPLLPPVPLPPAAPTAEPKPKGDTTVPYRPVRRPPMAVLCLLDDGRDDGEWVRIRKEKFLIGRTDGDLIVPHDPMMSGRHAEISRQQEKGRYRWFLSDLSSRNGTFVRVYNALLRHGQELLLGGRRYRFDAAPQGGTLPQGGPPANSDLSGWHKVSPLGTEEPQVPGTVRWDNVSQADLIPSLVELTLQGDGQRIFASAPDNWIGRDPLQCNILLDDPLVSPRHARLHKDAKNRWQIDNAGSLNGIWLRVSRIAIDGAGQFQLGEQRFILRVL
jgi:pSer/pThr/pTyr-binding forkhead associated (FHA) protein